MFGHGRTAGSTFWGRIAALGLVAAVVGVIAVAASACHPVVTASENCSGLVSYTVTAWNGSPRSNDNVSVQANGTQLASGAFNSSNGYSFTGTYQASSSGQVTITASGLGQWYDKGKSPVNETTKTSVQVSRSGNCANTQSTPTTTTTTTTTHTTPTTTSHTTTTQTTPTTTVPATTTTPPTTTTVPATTTTTPVAPPPTTTTSSTAATPVEHPGLALRKTERVGDSAPYLVEVNALPGQTVHYRMVVTNTGDTTMTLTFQDPRCDAGTLVAHGSRILAPGATTEYTCSHVLVSADGPTYVNRATVSGISATGATAGPVNSRSITRFPVVTAVLGAQKTLIAGTSKKAGVKPVTKPAKPAIAKVAPATFTG
ncbi:MAG TPA: hypothetical protein VG652_01495 [Gaiellaceae bacterium]|nr:hypothetical protein [Gaiellaceae bacterium]